MSDHSIARLRSKPTGKAKQAPKTKPAPKAAPKPTVGAKSRLAPGSARVAKALPTPRRAAIAGATRQALLVLGMHRSGTSALAGILTKLGAQPPRTLMPANEFNARGYWESQALMEFHDEVLASAGSRWSDWDVFNPDWKRSGVVAGFKKRLGSLIEQEFAGAPLLLVKDPRISRFTSLWLDSLAELAIEPKVIILVRHPLEVAQSLHTRDEVTRKRGQLIWLRHSLDAELATRGVDRVFVRYDLLLQDWRTQVRRMADRLAVAWPRWSSGTEVEIDQFLTSNLRHNRVDESADPDMSLIPWVRSAYGALLQLAGPDPDKVQAAMRALDQVRSSFDNACDIYGSVLHEQELLANRRAAALLTDQTREGDSAHSLVIAAEEQLAAARAELATAHEVIGVRDKEVAFWVEAHVASETERHRMSEEHAAIAAELHGRVGDRDAQLAQSQESIATSEAAAADLERALAALREEHETALATARDIAQRDEEQSRAAIAELESAIAAAQAHSDSTQEHQQALVVEMELAAAQRQSEVITLLDQHRAHCEAADQRYEAVEQALAQEREASETQRVQFHADLQSAVTEWQARYDGQGERHLATVAELELAAEQHHSEVQTLLGRHHAAYAKLCEQFRGEAAVGAAELALARDESARLGLQLAETRETLEAQIGDLLVDVAARESGLFQLQREHAEKEAMIQRNAERHHADLAERDAELLRLGHEYKAQVDQLAAGHAEEIEKITEAHRTELHRLRSESEMAEIALQERFRESARISDLLLQAEENLRTLEAGQLAELAALAEARALETAQLESALERNAELHRADLSERDAELARLGRAHEARIAKLAAGHADEIEKLSEAQTVEMYRLRGEAEMAEIALQERFIESARIGKLLLEAEEHLRAMQAEYLAELAVISASDAQARAELESLREQLVTVTEARTSETAQLASALDERELVHRSSLASLQDEMRLLRERFEAEIAQLQLARDEDIQAHATTMENLRIAHSIRLETEQDDRHRQLAEQAAKLESARKEQAANLESARNEQVAKFQKAQHDHAAEIAAIREAGNKQQWFVKALARELELQRLQLRGLFDRHVAVENSRTWRYTSVLRSDSSAAAPGTVPGAVELPMQEQARLIRQSGRFDAAWYLSTYSDLVGNVGDPILHYVQFGAAEGRNPAPDFNTVEYLRQNPDARTGGVNPLLHQLQAGNTVQGARRKMRQA